MSVPISGSDQPLRSSSTGIIGRVRSQIGHISTRLRKRGSGKAPAAVPLKLPELDVVKQLGTGTYGRVLLCKHKTTSTPYVVKCVNKEQTFIKEQQVCQFHPIRRELWLTRSRIVFKRRCNAFDVTRTDYDLALCLQDHILSERNALVALSEAGKECLFSVLLFRSLQDPENVLFVTEFVPGGELYSYIKNDGAQSFTF
jgi:serine/threonine protein kinase